MTARLALVLLLGAAACREASSEEAPVVAPPPPCAKCTLDVPANERGPVPLLVAMHGNHEDGADASKRWKDSALARGWAVLGLHCPRDQGCADGKWYKWSSTPAWVKQQVTEVVTKMPVDQTRLFLAGWSGGATAIGMHAQKWDRTFAAVVFHGGGQPPSINRDECPRSLPAYFLVGDANPAHPAAKRLRDYYQGCEAEHVWDLMPGANHKMEDDALDTSKANRILDWLEAHKRQPNIS